MCPLSPTAENTPIRTPRLLFISEAVTLAHVARPYALAKSLSAANWDIVFACADTYRHLFDSSTWQQEPIQSMAPGDFARRLAHGQRLYPISILQDYIKADIDLLRRIKPDVVIGDFRLSLSVSARLAKVPYIAISNAYWSPFTAPFRYPVPCMPMTRYLGVHLAQTLFSWAQPWAFAWHSRPLNILRKQFGLPALSFDLRRTYTDADITLYADVPELVPTHDLPPNHRYIGPIEWSPETPPPPLPQKDSDSQPIYVTLGSSGAADLIPRILEALGPLRGPVIVASAGVTVKHTPPNAIIRDFLPGDLLSRYASIVICNGGSPTSHQALRHGKPVLGIPSNLDQHLNMLYVSRSGAGLTLRPEHARPEKILEAVTELTANPRFRRSAEQLAAAFCRYNPGQYLEQAAIELMERAP